MISVGLANDDVTPPLVGLVPLALELSYWNSLTNDTANTQPVDGDGLVGSSGDVALFFDLDSPAHDLPLSIGRTLPTSIFPDENNFSGYAVVYATITDSDTSDTIDRVVGFGFVEATLATDGTSVDITCRLSRIAHENAAATLAFQLPVSGDELNEVMSLGQTVQQPLLAPVLAR